MASTGTSQNLNTTSDIDDAISGFKQDLLQIQAEKAAIDRQVLMKSRRCELMEAKARQKEMQLRTTKQQIETLQDVIKSTSQEMDRLQTLSFQLITTMYSKRSEKENLQRQIVETTTKLQANEKRQAIYKEKVQVAESDQQSQLLELQQKYEELKKLDSELEDQTSLAFKIANGTMIKEMEDGLIHCESVSKESAKQFAELEAELQDLDELEASLNEQLKHKKERSEKELQQLEETVDALESEENKLQTEFQKLTTSANPIANENDPNQSVCQIDDYDIEENMSLFLEGDWDTSLAR